MNTNREVSTWKCEQWFVVQTRLLRISWWRMWR